MPLVSITHEALCEGEKNMTAVDVITIRVVLKYDLLKEGEIPGWVCSKKYPFLKKHNWYIVIVDQ